MSFIDKWRSSTLGRSMSVLTRSDQKKIVLVIVLQIILNLLDLVGVALVGLLGALSISGIKSVAPGGKVRAVLNFVGIGNHSLHFQVAVLGITAGIFFITRSILSVFISRRVLYFLSRRGAVVSARLVYKLLSNSLLEIQDYGVQRTVFALTQGVNTITLGVLGTTVSLISDGTLLVILTSGLFVIDPVIASVMLAVFVFIAAIMYRIFNKRARALGMKDSHLSIRINERISEVLTTFRESIVRNRRQYYAQEIGSLRMQQAETQAEIAFMPSINKYVIESSVVILALVIGATQFALRDAVHAIALLSIFIAAGSRIAPAVLRVQQGITQIRGSLGSAEPTLQLLEKMTDAEELNVSDEFVDSSHAGFNPAVNVHNVSLKYPSREASALRNVNFSINPGEFVAIVGSSGAGKTSIIDVILGIIQPTSGFTTISGVTPSEAVRKWPGAIAYVPQDVSIINASVKNNIILGYPYSKTYDSLIQSAVFNAQLSQIVSQLPEGLDSEVGERGTSLSGGQRQRLGIARALFTNPKLLVLDEATSSLDGETESNISEAILKFKGEITTIVIAHRLSTIRSADKVIYFDAGEVKAVGSFEEVRQKVPDFDRQAKLMGL